MNWVLLQRRSLSVVLWLILVACSRCYTVESTVVDNVPTSGVYAEQWKAWKTNAGRIYGSSREEALRYSIWRDNMVYIDKHNADSDSHGFSLKMNSFGDLVSCRVATESVTHGF